MWNELIVSILTTRCTAPLSAVKGVAATYRMTNRPPPTQASPFVHTILRPIREFISTFAAAKDFISNSIGVEYYYRVHRIIGVWRNSGGVD
mmetsp:Transcript_6717/g.7785  ORF Transcript_6717/g.7785 Transcript_6717/m.7785 type:complete len:91 (+) Transcript_6717:200-472(+)